MDVQDMLVQSNANNNDDNENHWLWNSVRRIRRSLDKFLGTDSSSTSTDLNAPSQHIDSQSELNNNNNKKVRKIKKDHKIHGGSGNRRNMTGHKLHKANKHGKKHIAPGNKQHNNGGGKLKKNRNKMHRMKRQHLDGNGDAYPDDDEEEDDEDELNNEINEHNEINGSGGGHHIPSSPFYDNEIDANQKLEKLCKQKYLKDKYSTYKI